MGGKGDTKVQTVAFPVAFTLKVFGVFIGNSDKQGSGVDNAFAYPISTSAFEWANKGNTGQINPYFQAFAIAVGA